MTTHIYIAPPRDKTIGGYRMGNAGGYFIFMLTKKPNLLHRLGVRLVLGWKWVDHV